MKIQEVKTQEVKTQEVKTQEVKTLVLETQVLDTEGLDFEALNSGSEDDYEYVDSEDVLKCDKGDDCDDRTKAEPSQCNIS